MYEDYFGLERPPFKITPDTSLFFEGGKRGDILAALVYAIHRGEGIIKVVGEVGSGKTMLCRMLQLKLPDTVEIVYIANPSVSPEDILFVIAHELSLQVTREASKHEVMHQLHDYLLQRHMENKQVVLFVEEAQGMPLDTLEEIRLLSNLETDQNKLLQIILFGQPELDQNLAEQNIRQLRERITHNFELDPLTQDEIHNYLNFRMRQVGYTGPELINMNVARKIEQHSGGLLRRINIIADKILLSAFAEGTHNLSIKHVTAAVNDSAFDEEVGPRSRGLWWFGLIVVAALAFALYQTRTHWMSFQVSDSESDIQIAAINDKPVTDSAPPAMDTEPVVASEAEATEILDTGESTESAAGTEEVAAIEAAELKATEDQTEETPRVTEPVVTSEQVPVEADTRAEDGQVVRQVEAVVDQIEEALQQAESQVQHDEDVTLKKALDQASSSDELAAETNTDLTLSSDYSQWLNVKLQESKDWLSQADRKKVSIQVLMRNKSAARELVHYLRNDWPLELSKTYLYEVNIENRSIYRVFYSEFDTLSHGKNQLELLPESLKINSPYLHSVYRMQNALL